MVGGFRQLFKTDYPTLVDNDSLKKLVGGTIMDGTYEAYFGMLAGFAKARELHSNFNPHGSVYMEVGGASQQVAWYQKSQHFTGERFKALTLLPFGKKGASRISTLILSPYLNSEDEAEKKKFSLPLDEAKKLFNGEKTNILQFKSKRKNARKPFFKARLYLDSKFKPKFEMIKPEKTITKKEDKN